MGNKVTVVNFDELAILPYQPQAPIIERFEWLSDVIEFKNGTEERYGPRLVPRHFFEYKFPLQTWKKAEAFNTLYGAVRKNWAVPIWTEGQFVGDISPGQFVISCDTLVHDLQAGSLVMLFNGSDEFKVLEIESKTDTDITLAVDPGAMSGAYVLPVRAGFIVGTVTITTGGREALASVTFQIDDALNVPEVVPLQHKSDDIYFDAGLFGDSKTIDRVIEMRNDVNDFDIGIVAHSTPWLNARYSMPYKWLLDGAEEVRAFKEFLFRRSGKVRRFWLPTFENDLRHKSTGTISSLLVVESDSIIDYGSQRVNIAIEKNDGSWLVREVTNFQQSGAPTVELT